MEEFREKLTEVGSKALKIMEEFLEGPETQDVSNRVKYASKLIGPALAGERLQQQAEEKKKDRAMRLLKFLPKSPEMLQKYVELTNPDLKVLVLSKPEK